MLSLLLFLFVFHASAANGRLQRQALCF